MPKCPQCGTIVADTATYCSECGQDVSDVGDTTTLSSSVDAGDTSNTDTARHSMFYVGAVLGVLGVAFLPFLFILVALPEAILYNFRGSSILDSLSADARDNPAFKGSFLIFRWFGNFLILAFFVGVIIGIVAVL